MKVSPIRVFAVHLEVMTADKCIHRISISSMYKEAQQRVSVHNCVFQNLNNKKSQQRPCSAPVYSLP